MSHEQKRSFINWDELYVAELSTLMSALDTDKFNFRNHFDIIKLIRQPVLYERK